MIYPTIMWLMIQFSCSSELSSEPIVWQDDSKDIQTNDDTAPGTMIEEDEEDTGIEVPSSSHFCSSDIEIQIPTWDNPPAFGNKIYNQIEIYNPCSYPIVLLGSPMDWFENSNFSISQLPPNHIEPESSVVIETTFEPTNSGIFESNIRIPTDYKEITSHTQIEVQKALDLVLVGDGGLRVYIRNYGENPDDIDIQYESLLSTNYDFYDVCFGNNRFIAVGGDQSGTENAHLALQSKQAHQDWSDHSKSDNPIISCVYGDNFFVGISEHEQTPVHSLAGVQWQEGTRTPWMQHRLNDIAFGNGTFVAVGDQGRISKSIDGTEWTSDISSGNLDIHKIIYEQNRFVAVGEFGLILTSVNGMQWEEQVVGENTISHIVYANDHFLLSNGMKIYRSSDTLIWEEVKESDIKLLAKIGSLTFGFKGQDIYKCTTDDLDNCNIIATIPMGLHLHDATFEETSSL